MAHDRNRQEINRTGLAFSVLTLALATGWTVFQVYWERFSDTTPVFPLEIKTNEVLTVQTGDTVEQQFQITREGMQKVRLILRTGEEAPVDEADITVRLGTEGRQDFGVDLTGATLKESPLLTIELPEAGRMGERFALKLEFETGESLYHLPVTENEVVARWPYEAELRVNGRLLDTQLLFQPVYEEGEQVVAGDTVSLWREVERIGKELLEGRPDWVKGILLIAPMISLGLVGWFLYLAWEKVAGDLPEAEQQQMLRWLIIMGVVGGIVF